MLSDHWRYQTAHVFGQPQPSESVLPSSSYILEQRCKSSDAGLWEQKGGGRKSDVIQLLSESRGVGQKGKCTYILLADRLSRSEKGAKSIKGQDQMLAFGHWDGAFVVIDYFRLGTCTFRLRSSEWGSFLSPSGRPPTATGSNPRSETHKRLAQPLTN